MRLCVVLVAPRDELVERLVARGRVATFLAEGAVRSGHQMLIVDDPIVAQWPKDLVDRGVLVIASVAETYGEARTVDAATQRQTFAGLPR